MVFAVAQIQIAYRASIAIATGCSMTVSRQVTDGSHRYIPHLRRSRPLRSPASREKASMRLDETRSLLGAHMTSPVSTTLCFAVLLNLCMLVRLGNCRTRAMRGGALDKRRSIVPRSRGLERRPRIPDPRY